MDIYNVFLGMVIFQMIYIVFQYMLFERKEFIYYFVYTTMIAIYVTSKMSPAFYFNWFYTHEKLSIIDRSSITIAFGFYFKFGRLFTKTNELYPTFNRQVIYIENFLIGIGLLDAFLILAGFLNYFDLKLFFNFIHLLLIFYTAWVVFYLLKKKNILTSILVIGCGILLLFSAISFIDTLFISKGLKPETFYVGYIQIGIIAELLFLNYGLNFKTKLEQKEKIKLEVESRMTLANERNRISSDLHDDIGATLSSLHIYGDLAANIWDSKPNESKKMIEKISDTSKELMGRMGDIIWSMKPGDEEKFTLQARVKNYANELLSPKNIICEIEIDEKITSKITNPDVRKNILLIIKEGINNIAKYSQASESAIKFVQKNEQIMLLITDNGKGFDKKIIKNGNGLGNIEQRCQLLGGKFHIKSEIGQGTTIKCDFPMASISYTV